MNEHTLWYKNPETKYHDALPIGKGRLGAVLCGNVFTDRSKGIRYRRDAFISRDFDVGVFRFEVAKKAANRFKIEFNSENRISIKANGNEL